MARSPKLKIEGLGWEAPDELSDFEQAKYFPFDSRSLIIVAEGEVIRSFDDLIKLAERAPHKEKEFLKVVFLPVIVGG